MVKLIRKLNQEHEVTPNRINFRFTGQFLTRVFFRVQIHNKEHDSKYIHKHNTFTSTNNMRQRLCVDNVSTIDHLPLIFSLMSANANHYFIVANAIFNNNYFPSIMICARARSVWIYLVCLKISSLKRLIKVGFGGKVVRDKIV